MEFYNILHLDLRVGTGNMKMPKCATNDRIYAPKVQNNKKCARRDPANRPVGGPTPAKATNKGRP